MAFATQLPPTYLALKWKIAFASECFQKVVERPEILISLVRNRVSSPLKYWPARIDRLSRAIAHAYSSIG